MSTLSRVVLLAAPTGTLATVISSSRIDTSWNSVVGASAYRLYRNGVFAGDTADTLILNVSLTPSTLYSFQVATLDANGLEGPKGTAFTGTTLATPDVTAPSVPVIAVTTLSSSSQQVTLTTASTDTGGSGLASYTLERATNSTFTANLTTEATGLSIFPRTVTGLNSSTTYYYRARATDGASNTSANSAAVNATTSASSGTVSGFTPASGYTLTDNGNGTWRLTRAAGGLGTKPVALPLWYFSFESSLNADSGLSRNSGSLSPHSGASIQTSVRPTNAAGACRVVFDSPSTALPFTSPFAITTTETYAFYKTRWDHTVDFPATSLKNFRMWKQGTSEYDIWSGPDGGAQPEGSLTNTDSSAFPHHYFTTSQNTWWTREQFYKASSAVNVANGEWFARERGVRNNNQSRKWTTRTSTHSALLHDGYFHQYSENPSQTHLEDASDFFQKMYIDDSVMRIGFCNTGTISNSAGGAAYDFEVCVSTAWSDTEIDFVPNFGSFSNKQSGVRIMVATAIDTHLIAGSF